MFGFDLRWGRNGGGYDLVAVDRTLVEWSVIDGPDWSVPPGAIDKSMSPDARRAVERWGMFLAPNEDDEKSLIQVIEPIGGSAEIYFPLRRQPDLYSKFANTEPTKKGLLGFANEYGPLDHGPQRFDTWLREIKRIRTVVEEIARPTRRSNAKAIRGAFEQNAPTNFFGLGMVPKLDVNDDGLQFYVEVPDLRSAMWLQLGAAATGKTHFVQCSECPNFIPISVGVNRADRQTCSGKCRVAKNRRLKRGRNVAASV